MNVRPETPEIFKSAAAIALLVTAATAATMTASGATQLPAELPLEAQALALELDNAKLEIVLEEGAEGWLHAAALSEGVDHGEVLDLRRDGGQLTIARVDSSPAADPRLALRLRLDPVQQLSIRGRELVVTVTHEQPQEGDGAQDLEEPAELELPAEQGEDTGDDPGTSLRLSVEGSQVTLIGVGETSVRAVRSSVRLDNCHEALTLVLEGGAAQIHDHRGPLQLDGEQGEFTVVRNRGQMNVKLDGGGLQSNFGRGALTAHVEDAYVGLERWGGRLSVKGHASTIDAYTTTSKRAALEGQDLNITIESWNGPLNARLTGGGLTGNGVRGKAIVNARAWTSVELQNLKGSLSLNLRDDSSAELVRIIGSLKADVTDSTIQIDTVQNLHLGATSSRVDIAGVRKLTQLTVKACEANIDLTGLSGKPTIALQAQSRAWVRLSTPCSVRTSGPGSALGNQVRISGCDYRARGRTMPRPIRGVDGQRTVQLTVSMAADAELEVEGAP
jgi:hypothetical protein